MMADFRLGLLEVLGDKVFRRACLVNVIAGTFSLVAVVLTEAFALGVLGGATFSAVIVALTR